MIIRGDIKKKAEEKRKIEAILDEEFFLQEHRKKLEEKIEECNLIVAFRPAGRNTIKKLEAGAAAKPHSILAKTIKINDVKQTLMKEIGEDELVKKAVDDYKEEIDYICGLVGVRQDDRGLGLYLSSKGETKWANATFEEKPVIIFTDMITMLNWAKENKISEIMQDFITGDYDIHEIQYKEGTAYQHLESDSLEEANILKILSTCANAPEAESEIENGIYKPAEYNPIQHGAQDNYLAHMFKKEKDQELVEKVLLPDIDIAIYNGELKEWCIIYNLSAGGKYSDLIALYNQVSENKFIYELYGVEIPEFWDFIYDDELQLILMDIKDKAPLKCVNELKMKIEIYEGRLKDEPELQKKIDFLNSLIKMCEMQQS